MQNAATQIVLVLTAIAVPRVLVQVASKLNSIEVLASRAIIGRLFCLLYLILFLNIRFFIFW